MEFMVRSETNGILKIMVIPEWYYIDIYKVTNTYS